MSAAHFRTVVTLKRGPSLCNDGHIAYVYTRFTSNTIQVILDNAICHKLFSVALYAVYDACLLGCAILSRLQTSDGPGASSWQQSRLRGAGGPESQEDRAGCRGREMWRV